MAFDVRVVNHEGKGVRGARVVLGFTSILRGMTKYISTDSGGHAQFDGYDEREVEVFIDGSSYGRFQYHDGGGVTVCT